MFAIPIVCFAIVGAVGAYMAYYNITDIQPKAEEQFEYFQTLSCDQVLSLPSQLNIYSKDNRDWLNDKKESCSDAREKERQKEKERLDALLADPNSYESLSREYEKLKNLVDALQDRYDALKNETGNLEKEIVNYTNRMTEIQTKITIPEN